LSDKTTFSVGKIHKLLKPFLIFAAEKENIHIFKNNKKIARQ